MNPAEAQKYWDACLIKTWRSSKRLRDTIQMFTSITGESPWKFSDMLRLPPKQLSWNVQTKYFVAHYLPKISDRLWGQPPEKDVALLNKLQGSEYTTLKNQLKDLELDRERRKARLGRERLELIAHNIAARNSSTDWNVVKSNVRKRMA